MIVRDALVDGGAMRRLSDVEAAFALMNIDLSGATQVVTQVSIEARFDNRRIRDACAQWVLGAPILRQRIEMRGTDLHLVADAEEPGSAINIVDLEGVPDLDQILENELNEPLPEAGSLWRLTFLRCARDSSTHLFFVRTHAISDGATTAYLVRSLIDNLLGSTPPTSPAIDVGEASLNPDLYPLTRPPILARPTSSRTFSDSQPESIPLHTQPQVHTGRSEFVSWQINKVAASGFMNWAKWKGWTINELLATALAEATAHALDRESVGIYTAVSLRPWYEEQVRLAPGCTIGVVETAVHVNAGFEGALQSYREGLATAMAHWSPPRREHTTIKSQVASLLDQVSSRGVCITNTGRADSALGRHKALISRYRTIVNRRAANYAVVLHAGSLDGQFDLTLSYGSPCIERAFVEKVQSGICSRLDAVSVEAESRSWHM